MSILSLSRQAAGEVPIVFVSRQLRPEPAADSRNVAIERAQSGRLLLREATGAVRILVAPGAGSGIDDVMDPDVSYDGTRVLFAGYSPDERAWRIYEIGAGGEGLRQITFSDRNMDLTRYGAAAELFRTYDDVDPCYMPDGRICFVSTRYPGVAPDGRQRTTNLYVVGDNGSNLHRITSERFGADTPAIDPTTGQIVYSRWWRTAQAVKPSEGPAEPIPPGSPGYGDAGSSQDSELILRSVDEEQFPGVNSWFLSSLDPDGTNLAMYSGFRIDRQLTQAYRPSFLASGEALALFIPETPFLGYPRGNGLRLFHRGPSIPEQLGGPQTFPASDANGFPFDPARPPAGVPPLPFPAPFVYASAAALEDGRILVTAAMTDGPSADYGVFIQNKEGMPVPLYNNIGSAELDAIPLVSRKVPPVIKEGSQKPLLEEAPRTLEEAISQGGSFTFLCENIFGNAPVNTAIANAPPVGQSLAIEFYMAPQRTGTTTPDAPILIRSIDIPADGKIETVLPAGVPLFEVLRRPNGTLPLGRDGQIFHVGGMNFGRSGETNRCMGCHAGHSQMEVPLDPTWTNLAPSAVVRASSSRSLAIDVVGNGKEFFGGMFSGSNLVDRQTGSFTEDWAALKEPESRADLLWSTRLRAKEAVVYGTTKGKGVFGERNQTIKAFDVELLLDRKVQQRIHVNQEALPEGTKVPLDPAVVFDTLSVVIQGQDVIGIYESDTGAALGEVEVIGQAVGMPVVSFLRGDADCSSRVDIVDVIIDLAHLFLGTGPVCCAAAADANNDHAFDITDPIYLMGFMFLGGAMPPQPFPACGPSSDSDAVCDVSVCR